MQLSNEQVARLVNRDPKTINTWAQRGHVYFLQEHAPGRGRARVFDRAGSVHVFLTNELHALGYDIGAASHHSRTWCYMPRLELPYRSPEIPPMTPYEDDRTLLMIFSQPDGIASSHIQPGRTVTAGPLDEDLASKGYKPLHRAFDTGYSVTLIDLAPFMERFDEAVSRLLASDNQDV